jgi:hypothetical protein
MVDGLFNLFHFHRNENHPRNVKMGCKSPQEHCLPAIFWSYLQSDFPHIKISRNLIFSRVFICSQKFIYFSPASFHKVVDTV